MSPDTQKKPTSRFRRSISNTMLVPNQKSISKRSARALRHRLSLGTLFLHTIQFISVHFSIHSTLFQFLFNFFQFLFNFFQFLQVSFTLFHFISFYFILFQFNSVPFTLFHFSLARFLPSRIMALPATSSPIILLQLSFRCVHSTQSPSSTMVRAHAQAQRVMHRLTTGNQGLDANNWLLF